jgi:hypothetical protein
MSEFTAYATKAISPTMEAFADWILEEVFEGQLPEGLDSDHFRRSVALGGSLRMQFQKSESWKSDSRNYLANVEANRAAKAAEAAEKAEESLRKAQERVKVAKAKAAAAAKIAAEKVAAEGTESEAA